MPVKWYWILALNIKNICALNFRSQTQPKMYINMHIPCIFGKDCLHSDIVPGHLYLSWDCGCHDDVIKWKHFPRNWPFVRVILPVTGELPAQRPVTRSFDVFFDLSLNKRLSKQSRRRWFETPSCSLWRHCNGGRTQWQVAGPGAVCEWVRFSPHLNMHNIIIIVSTIVIVSIALVVTKDNNQKLHAQSPFYRGDCCMPFLRQIVMVLSNRGTNKHFLLVVKDVYDCINACWNHWCFVAINLLNLKLNWNTYHLFCSCLIHNLRVNVML